jgi:hypothetical protein
MRVCHVARNQSDIRSFSGQSEGSSLANAAASSRDDRETILEF